MIQDRETWHEVKDDESLPLIAAEYGIKDWQLIYNHAQNGDLRRRRPNPNLLYKGDRVWIPKVEPRQFSVATNQRQTFVLYPPKTVLQLVLQDEEGAPYGGVKYEIWIAGERFNEQARQTREDGLIFEYIPLAKEVELRVWFPVPKADDPDDDAIKPGQPGPIDEYADPWGEDDAEPLPPEELMVDPNVYQTYILKLGGLDPLETIEGVQDRLTNLGYPCDGEQGQLGSATQAAIRQFQADNGLAETGSIDLRQGSADATLAALAASYGDTPRAQQ